MHVRPLSASPLQERAKKLYVELAPEPVKPPELVKHERRRVLGRVGAAALAATSLAPVFLSHPYGSVTGMLGSTISSVLLGAAVGARVEDMRLKAEWPIPVALYGTMAAGLALGVAANFYGNPVLWSLNAAVGATGMVFGTNLLERSADHDIKRLRDSYEKKHAAWEVDTAKALEPRGAAGPRDIGEREGLVMVGGVRLPRKSAANGSDSAQPEIL